MGAGNYNNEKYDRLEVYLKKGEREAVKAYAKRYFRGVSNMVNVLIKEDMKKRGGKRENGK